MNRNDVHTDFRPPDTALLERLDRLPITRMHVAVLLLCGLGLCFDLMEIALGNALLAVFAAAPYSFSTAELSWLAASVYIGAIVGAPTMGWLADRIGRTRVLAMVLLLLSATSLAAALSQGVGTLILARGLSGLALGAFPPLMVLFLTDILPARQRGALIVLVCAVGSLGAPLGIFLIREIGMTEPLGLPAWRWVFLLGTAGALIVGGLMLRMPESPRWLGMRSRADEADRQCRRFEVSRTVWRAAASPSSPVIPPKSLRPAALRGRRGFGFLSLVYFLAAWSTVAFPLLSGAILAQKGFKLSDTLLYVGISMFGPVLGNLMAAPVIDRVERRTALIACMGAMLVSGLIFVSSATPAVLILASSMFSLVVAVFLPTLNVYATEAVGGNSSASLIVGAWAFNRLGAAAGPLLLLPLLRYAGPMSMYAVMSLALLAGIALLLIGPKGRARQLIV